MVIKQKGKYIELSNKLKPEHNIFFNTKISGKMSLKPYFMHMYLSSLHTITDDQPFYFFIIFSYGF
jgi:hypothetical protein